MRECAGIIYQRFSDLEMKPIESLLDEVRHMPGYPAISQAITESEFHGSHPHSRINIVWRYCRDGMPTWLAVLGIRNGYSSPSEWRHAHRLHRRIGITRADFKPIQH